MVRHHLVPQMYLRLFADGSEKLRMVDRTNLEREHSVTVNNACNEIGFYTIPTEDVEPYARIGHDPEALEKSLAEVERRTVPVIGKLLTTDTMPGPNDMVVRNGHEGPWDRYQLALFVALQMTRTWGFRRELNELLDHSFNRQKEAIATDERIVSYLARQGKPARPRDVREFRDRLLGPDGPSIAFGNSRMTQAAVQYAVETAHPELLNRRWHLRVFDDPVLLTSDAPVAMRTAGPPGTPVPGLVNASEIYWPVGRHHLLSFERRTPRDEMATDKVTVSADPARGRIANSLIAAQAEKWIFHHPADRPLTHVKLTARPELVEEMVRVIETPDAIRVTKRVLRRQT